MHTRDLQQNARRNARAFAQGFSSGQGLLADCAHLSWFEYLNDWAGFVGPIEQPWFRAAFPAEAYALLRELASVLDAATHRRTESTEQFIASRRFAPVAAVAQRLAHALSSVEVEP